MPAEGSPPRSRIPLPNNVPDVIPAKRLAFNMPQNRNFSSNVEHVLAEEGEYRSCWLRVWFELCLDVGRGSEGVEEGQCGGGVSVALP